MKNSKRECSLVSFNVNVTIFPPKILFIVTFLNGALKLKF